MKITRILSALLLLLSMSACGPMIGSMMVSENGVKQLDISSEQNGHLLPGSDVAVLGPFAATPEGFYICRGEEAALFAAQFNQTGLFNAELAMPTRFPDEVPNLASFRGQSPEQVKASLKLQRTPHYLMAGTILKRETVIAPAKGVIMRVSYQLQFLDLVDGQTSKVEVAVQSFFKDAVPSAVNALAAQIEGAK